MEISDGFAYNPGVSAPPTGTPTPPPEPPNVPPPPLADNADLGLLSALPGVWKGTGFNAIWRPHQPGQDRFLELNFTTETIRFTRIPGKIPNRGLLQGDLEMTGLTYEQQIADSNVLDANGQPSGLHIEPGVWLSIPATTNPQVPDSVARLATIPHGTALTAQGIGFVVAVPPRIDPTSLNPFPKGNPAGAFTFPEQDLSIVTEFRTPQDQIPGLTQEQLRDPHVFLNSALAGKTIETATVLQVTTSDTPILGGGIANTAFLEGSAGGPNADASLVTATFWIEKVTGQDALQLQYTQTVLLDFNGLSWPHVTVATLTKQPA